LQVDGFNEVTQYLPVTGLCGSNSRKSASAFCGLERASSGCPRFVPRNTPCASATWRYPAPISRFSSRSLPASFERPSSYVSEVFTIRSRTAVEPGRLLMSCSTWKRSPNQVAHLFETALFKIAFEAGNDDPAGQPPECQNRR
jgi:hypothetical protein